jgi:hypothetical protein
MKDLIWKIEWHNDVGPDDEGYWEWWEVSDGVKTFRCDSEDDAKWLLSILNTIYQILK